MKFGQRIRQEEAACLHGPLIELSDHFLRYKELKKMLSKMSKVLYHTCCRSRGEQSAMRSCSVVLAHLGIGTRTRHFLLFPTLFTTKKAGSRNWPQQEVGQD